MQSTKKIEAPFPGAVYAGEFRGLPLFDMPDVKDSINTVEGWEKYRQAVMRRRLTRELGREPSWDEIQTSLRTVEDETRELIAQHPLNMDAGIRIK